MKKLLSIALAVLMLGMSVAVGAVAAFEETSLQFELPVVTGIEAVWDGELDLGSNLNLRFGPNNVTVTVSFEDGDPEVLTRWDGGNRWPHRWQVFTRVDFDLGVVTVFYSDGLLEREAGIFCCCEWTDEFLATLPQDSFEFPLNFLQAHFEAQSITALALDQRARVLGDSYFSFTPNASGYFHFQTHHGWILLDGSFRVISQNWNHSAIWLEAGSTYTLRVHGWYDEATTVMVVEGQWTHGGGGSSGNWAGNLRNWIWDIGWQWNQSWVGRIGIALLSPIWVPALLTLALFEWIITGWW